MGLVAYVGSMGLVGYGFSYKNTRLVELAARERLTRVSCFYGDILRLEVDVCLIDCCGGLTRQTVVVVPRHVQSIKPIIDNIR